MGGFDPYNDDEQISGGSGADPISGGVDPAAIAELLKGAPSPLANSPVTAARMASTRDRIYKVLERSLSKQESPFGRLDDVAAAGEQWLASQGRNGVGTTLEALDQTRLGKTAGILGTLGKLEANSQQQMTPYQVGSLFMRQLEVSARQGNAEDARIDAILRRNMGTMEPEAAQQFSADAAMAFIQAKQANPRFGPMDAERIVGDLLRTGKYTAKTKNEREPSFEEKIFGKMTPQQQQEFIRRRAEGAGGEGISVTLPDGTAIQAGGKSAAANKAVNTLSDGEKTATMFVGQLDDMRKLVEENGASVMGVSGFLSRWIGSAAAQLGAFAGDVPAGKGVKPAEVIKSFPWLGKYVANEGEAAQFVSGVTALAYAYSKAVDPGGRITDQDVKHALNVLGASGSPTQMMAAFKQLENDVIRRRNIERRAAWQSGWGEFKPFNPRAWTGGEVGGAAPVAAPGAGPAKITNDAEYNALPSGQEYIAPDGSVRKKR